MNDDNQDSAPEGPHGGAPTPRVGEKVYWLDDFDNVRKIYFGLWIVCGLLVGADLLYEKHPHFPIEAWFGFYGFYGFVSCVSLVLAAKVLRRIVMRPEDYYEDRYDE